MVSVENWTGTIHIPYVTLGSGRRRLKSTPFCSPHHTAYMRINCRGYWPWEWMERVGGWTILSTSLACGNSYTLVFAGSELSISGLAWRWGDNIPVDFLILPSTFEHFSYLRRAGGREGAGWNDGILLLFISWKPARLIVVFSLFIHSNQSALLSTPFPIRFMHVLASEHYGPFLLSIFAL